MARPVCSECRYMHQQHTPNFRVRMFCGLAEDVEIKMYRKKRPDWYPLLDKNIVRAAGKRYKYELENEDGQEDKQQGKG